MKRLPGAHGFLGLVVCDRCGRKELRTRNGLELLREHIRKVHPTAPATLSDDSKTGEEL
jgi:hypothetical protein